MKGIPDHLRLFVDLLHHEMLEAVFPRSLFGEGYVDRLLLDLVSIQVVEVDLSRADPCEFEIINIVDLPRVGKDRRNI